MQKNMAENSIVAEFADLEVLNAMVVLLDSEDKEKLVDAAFTIATQFGADKSFAEVLKSDAEDPCMKLISSFHNNLNLLVQKTWVEKADEALKEQVLFRLDNLCNALTAKKEASYEDFVVLLKDVVYLMFGNDIQGAKENFAKTSDFAEYALRIDPGFGIFWWYLTSIPETAPASEDKKRIFFALGMVFLANY